MKFLAKVMKKNVRPVKTAQLLSKHFPSGLSLCIIYSLFHKGKNTSAIPQPSVQHLVYVFPIFFCFHKYFNNFLLTLYFPMFHFDPPENIRKPLVFWCFQGDQKGTLGSKGLSKNILNKLFH